MGALSLRLPDALDQALTSEAEMKMKPRSVVVGQALAEYLERMVEVMRHSEIWAANLNPNRSGETGKARLKSHFVRS